jgi:lipopolysaccharide export system protein LptA
MITPILQRSLLLLAIVGLTPGLLAVPDDISKTLITSLHLEMQGTAGKNYFYFSGDVEVKGTNLVINCDELTVVSLREGSEGATVGSIGAIEEIIAQGNVEIHQAGRSAYAGLAEVNPQLGTVVLSESPRIVDDEVEVEGYQFVLHKGEKKFTSVPDPNAPAEEPSRSVVRLGAMPDLGFDQEEESISVDDSLEPGDTANEERGDNVTTP